MQKNDPRKALGKGLSSLLPNRVANPAPASQPTNTTKIVNDTATPNTGVQVVSIQYVIPNPNQPRRDFDETALLELSQSIERDGIIQPLLVRRAGAETYQIIAGERRYRAAKLAGLTEVPVVVREANDEKVLELAIVENIQREDLNPIELAVAFQRMVTELGLSHEQVGEKTGKQRVTITNSLRLLQLPEDLRQMVAAGTLSAGHARALLKLGDAAVQREVAQRAVAEGWSVRQIEEFTKPAPLEPGPEKKQKPEPKPLDPNVKAAIDELESLLGTRVRLVEKGSGKKMKGHLEIEFYSEEDLNRIYEIIVPTPGA